MCSYKTSGPGGSLVDLDRRASGRGSILRRVPGPGLSTGLCGLTAIGLRAMTDHFRIRWTQLWMCLLCVGFAVGGCADECPSGNRDAAGACVDGAGDSGVGQLDGAVRGLAATDASHATDAESAVSASTDPADGGASGCSVEECTGGTQCDEDSGRCVECLQDSDCSAGSGGRCVAGACAGCQADSDCVAPDAPHCDMAAERCVGCSEDAHCQGIEEGERSLPVCDANAGRCVECIGTNYAACGFADDGTTPLVCDSLAQSCSAEAEGNGDLCGGCLSDAQCPSGARCVPETFSDQVLGYVCLPVQNADEVGPDSVALEDCLGQGRPYVDSRAQVVSIDGDIQDVCALAHTTCKAMLEHGVGVEGCNADHALLACGHEDLADALCRSPEGSLAYRCVTPCSSSDDCKSGFACNQRDQQEDAFCDFQRGTCFADTDCPSDKHCNSGRNVCE